MSFFEGQDAGWSQHRRQQSWEPSTAGVRPGPSPSQASDNESAFASQFEEVSRAADNLSKSGKGYGAPPPGGWPSAAGGGMHGRRESMPMMGAFQRQLGEFSGNDSRTGPPRHMSVSEERGAGAGGNIQGYLAHQRFPSRPSEAEQVMQAKRRAAAQRERDLRNYHQEQQFNRKGGSGPKSDRSMSPGTGMSEEDRRELIARQHRALYGENSQLYVGGENSRPLSQDARLLAASSSGHGSSPLAYDAYAATTGEAGAPGLAATAGTSNSPRDGTQSPQSAATNKQFAMFDSAKPGSTPTTNSPPVDGPGHNSKISQSGAVAPIGTRPTGGASGKRNTPPAPSPLGFGAAGERSQSAASNPSNGSQQPGDKGVGLGWNGGSGAWGSSRQASVWG